MVRVNQPRRLARCWCAPLLLSAFFACKTGAQTASPAPGAEAKGAPLYRIAGRVVDTRSGAALSRCAVEIVEVKKGIESHTMRTGDDGRFSFEGLPVAKYRLSASKPGFGTQSYEQHGIFSTAIAVGPGLVSEDLLFKVTPGAVLSGTVTDESGEPVRQAQIKLYGDQELDGVRSTRQQAAAATDDRGVYELANIAPGAYFLSVSAHPWYARSQHTTPGSSPGNADLDVGYPTTFYPDVTDADAASLIPIKGGERLQADFILHAERAMHLHIPMSQAEIRNGYSVSLSQSVFGQPESIGFTITSDDSGAEIEGLPSGHYDVTVAKNIRDHQIESHFSADVGDGSTQISDTDNRTEAAVTGTVTSSDSKLPSHSGIVLMLTHTQRAYFAALNDAGEFTVSVPSGSYEVRGQIYRHYLATISASGASLVGRVLTVKAGSTPRLQISLGSSYGQIDGTVMHDKNPASAAMVLLVPDHPGENQVLFRRDQSDSDGTFTLSGILPGHYRVVAIERGWELEWANPRVLAPFLAKGLPVDVRGNDHLDEAVQLQMR